MIQAKDIRAGYGDGSDILHGISFEVHAGEIVAILGPHGCGKSTLIKTLVGFLKLRGGTVEIDAENVTTVPFGQKFRHPAVGYVPQAGTVSDAMTVMENLLLVSRELNWEVRAQRLDKVLELFPHLANKRRQKATALSSSSRQILSLSQALMTGPRILLLDAPSAGMPPAMMHEVFDAIVRIRDEEDMTILMVERNAFGALSVADRAYVMTLGKVVLTAPAQDLLNHPEMERLNLDGNRKADDPGAGPVIR